MKTCFNCNSNKKKNQTKIKCAVIFTTKKICYKINMKFKLQKKILNLRYNEKYTGLQNTRIYNFSY